jgi:hypothetical protein
MPSLPWFANKGQIIQIVLAALATGIAGFLAWPRFRENALLSGGAVLFYVLVLLVVVSLVTMLALSRQKPATASVAPQVEHIETLIRYNTGRDYPLKCYAQMRKDSAGSIDVRVIRFTPKSATLKKFVTGILQVRFADWCPQAQGVDRLAVLPGQYFQAWIGLDESKFTEEAARGLRGRIGTLVLTANGHHVDINL